MFNAALNKFHQIVHRKREPDCIGSTFTRDMRIDVQWHCNNDTFASIIHNEGKIRKKINAIVPSW